MPHFYLHLRNAHVDASDDEGLELPDLASAKARAIAGIRDFIGHEAMKGELDFRGYVDIVDDAQTILATVSFADAFKIRGLESVEISRDD